MPRSYDLRPPQITHDPEQRIDTAPAKLPKLSFDGFVQGIIQLIKQVAGIDLSSWDNFLASLFDGEGIDLPGLGSVLIALQAAASTALTNAANALGQISSFLTAAGYDTMLTLGNAFRDTVLTFTNILNGLGLSSVSAWILDMLGVKNLAGTANTNASNALGQLGAIISNAAAGTAATLGNIIASAKAGADQAVTNFANILTGFGLGSVANWITDLLGTKSTAGTAGTNASNALGQLGQIISNAGAGTAATVGAWLSTARSQAQTAVNNFADVLTGFGLGSVANWITDLLGTRSTAGTASTNASNALGQLSQLISNAGQSLASGVGTMLAQAKAGADQAILNFTNILSGMGMSNIANLILDWTGTRSTAGTAAANATTALTNAQLADIKAILRTGKNMVLDSAFSNASMWNTSPNAAMVTTTAARSGDQCRRVNANVNQHLLGGGDGSYYEPVAAGELYYGETWVRKPDTNTTGGSTYIRFEFTDSKGVLAAVNVSAPSLQNTSLSTSDWTRSTVIAEVPVGYDRMRAFHRVDSNFPAGQHILVDDATVQEVTRDEANRLAAIAAQGAANTAGTNATNALGQLSQMINGAVAGTAATFGTWLATARSQAQQATNNFADVLTNFGLGSIANWITDLLGTRSTAGTASTNATNALGQITSMVNGAVAGTAATLGNWVATARTQAQQSVNNFADVLTGFGLGTIGNWITDLLGTRSTASTASTNASTALSNASTANTGVGQLRNYTRVTNKAGGNLASDPDFESADMWSQLESGTTFCAPSTEESLSGTTSLKIVTSGSATPSISLIRDSQGTRGLRIPAKAGDRVSIEAQVKQMQAFSSGGRIRVNFAFYDSKGVNSATANPNPTTVTLTPGAWTPLSHVATVPDGYDEVLARINFTTTPAAGDVYFVDRAIVNEYTKTQSVITKLWEAFTGATAGSDPLDTLLKTVAAAVKSTSDTAGANATNALGQLTSMVNEAVAGTAANLGNMLATARSQAQTAVNNFADILSGFGLGTVGTWITDLLGTRSTAGTASTNATNALGQLTALINNAGQSLASGVGTMLANAAENTRLTLLNLWQGLTGSSSTADRTPAEVKTASAAVKSTSDTASTNATTAGGNATNALTQLSQIITNAGQTVATGVGTMLSNAAENTRLTLLNLWQGLTGSASTADRSPAEVKTASAAVKSTADTGVTNAATADGKATMANSKIALSTAANMVTDPGFEDPTIWTQPTGISLSTAQKRSGSRSMALTGPSRTMYLLNGNSGVGSQRTTPASPGDRIQIKTWVFRPSANGAAGGLNMGFTALDASGATVGGANVNTSIGQANIPYETWTELTTVLSVPPGTVTIRPYLQTTSQIPSTEVLHLDDSYLQNQTLAVIAQTTADAAQGTATAANNTVAQLALDPENLVAGSDFETDNFPWNTSATGGGRGRDTTVFDSGTASYRLGASSGSPSYTGPPIEMRGGEQLAVTLRARRDAAFNATDARLRLGANPGNVNHANLAFTPAVLPEADTWYTRTLLTNPYPDGTTRLNPSMNMTWPSGAAGNVWVDNIVIRRVKPEQTIPSLPESKIPTLTPQLSTIGSNATNALGQISQMISGAVSGTAANLGSMLSNAVGNIQSTWNSLWEGLTGGSGGTRTLAEVKTASAAVKSTSDTAQTNAATAGGNASSALTQLSQIITGAGQTLATGVGTMLANAKSAADTAVGNFTSIFTNFSVPNIGSWITDLLGTKSTAATAGSNASTALGNAQTIVDNIAAGLGNLVSNNPFSSVIDNFAMVFNLGKSGVDGAAANAAQIAALQATAAGGNNGGKVIVIDFSTFDDGAVPATLTKFYNDGASDAVISGGKLAFPDPPGNASGRELFRYNADVTLSNYQEVSAVMGWEIEHDAFGNTGYNYIIVRLNAAGTQYAIVQFGYNDVRIGYVNGHSSIQWAKAAKQVSVPGGSIIRVRAGTNVVNGERIYQAVVGNAVVDAWTDSGNVTAVGPNNRGAGLGFQGTSRSIGGQYTPAPISLFSIVDNIPQPVVGQGLQVYRNAGATGGFNANTNNPFPNGFFDMIEAQTADISWDSATATATVNASDWYHVSFSGRINTAIGSTTSDRKIETVLIINGTVRRRQTPIAIPVIEASGDTLKAGFQASFAGSFYCPAGTTIKGGINPGPGGVDVMGNAGGDFAYLTIVRGKQ